MAKQTELDFSKTEATPKRKYARRAKISTAATKRTYTRRKRNAIPATAFTSVRDAYWAGFQAGWSNSAQF